MFEFQIEWSVFMKDQSCYACKEESSSLSTWFLGLIFGSLTGFVLALLSSPKSGAEIRENIKLKARNLPDKASKIVDETIDFYAGALNYGQLVIEEQTSRVKSAVAAGKLAAAKKREELEMESGSVLPLQHR